MAHVENIQAQKVRTHDHLIYDGGVYTVVSETWTDDGLRIKLGLKGVTFGMNRTVEISCDKIVEILRIY